jgi:hypothetical protein
LSEVINFSRFPGPPRTGDSNGAYTCKSCGDVMYIDVVSDHEYDAQICYKTKCLEDRLRVLVGYERKAKRIAELLGPRQFSIEPKELLAEVLAVALAGEFHR